MQNEDYEIERYELIEPSEENQIEYFLAEEIICENINGASYDKILRIYFKTYNSSKNKSYKITNKFAVLLENKTTYMLVAGPINGLFILKVTPPNGIPYFQIVDIFGSIIKNNIESLERALYCIKQKNLPELPSVFSGRQLK